MKKSLFHVAPAFIFICFLGLMSMLIPDTVNAQAANSVMCCINGQLSRTTSNDCQAKRGHVFTNERDAQKSCPLMAKCYCCDNGVSTLTTLGTCRIKNNPCYKTKEEAANLCKPSCFCCANDQVMNITQAECKGKNGVCYKTQSDAMQRCQKPK